MSVRLEGRPARATTTPAPDDVTTPAHERTEQARRVKRVREPRAVAAAQGARLLLASLSCGAAVIHFALMPSRFEQYWAYGVFFAVVAWAQLAWALGMSLRPSRALLFSGLLNVVVVAVWALSRTAGVAFGPQASVKGSVGVAGVLATSLEVAIVLGCLLLAYRPRLVVARPRLGGLASAFIGGLVVLLAVGVTIALTPRFTPGGARNKAAPAAGVGTAGGVAHIHTTGLASADESVETQPDQPLDAATRQKVADQLIVARQVAMQYPTVADATKAGWILAGGFAPLAGAHYISFANSTGGMSPTGGVDPTKPGSLIYDGTSPTSRVVGLMYLSLSATQPAEGFAGPNDHWHRHSNVCIKYGAGGIQVPFPVDSDVTKPQCDGVHGTFMRQTLWMVHAWVVPGWESPLGVFSHANPNLRCADASLKVDKVGFCKGT